MSKPISDPVFDIGRDLQRAYDEGYKQGRYDEKQDAIDALEEQLDYLQMLNKDENPKAESKWYGVNWARNTIAALPSADRLIKETVGTLIHTKGDDAVSVAFRNAGRLVRNAIDGEPPEFEEIPSADRPKDKWIPIKWHTITEEEREREGYPKEWAIYLDCEMPADNESILVQTHGGSICEDVCYADGEYSLDSGYDWIEDIVAWRPMPSPWKGEK